jgi:hypothetical protein
MAIWRALIGSSRDISLENRVLNTAILASAAIGTGILIENVLLRLPTINIAITSIAMTVFWLLYVHSRTHPGSRWSSWIYLGFSCVMIVAIWATLKQYNGLALPFLLGVAGVVPLITTRDQARFGHLCVGFTYGLVVVLTVFVGGRIGTGGDTKLTLIIYLAEVGVLALALSIVTRQAIASFRFEQARAHRSQAELEGLNAFLLEKNDELEAALTEVRELRGILPICSHCKKIRNDQGYWNQLEEYFNRHTDVRFSHSICPACMEREYPAVFQKMRDRGEI